MTSTTQQDPTRRESRPLRPGAGRRLLLALGAGASATVLVVGAAQVSGAAPDTKAPAPDTIVKVTGNADSGFGIAHYDGSTQFPPTTSEAMAECQEYPKKIGRVRCRKETQVWYRDLADLKQAIKYARRAG
ncbi:hypothetical protein I601_0403 [Nocardioides dokdonensis FR1436]|uniref:Uncharacterized protein n=1 Tax=Nocardioides dokdonensis FR1436 TaxID=1300347 RepID=A0A1A9GH94_9ACTN|nr:hypothetical protein [Nocardioides dokdonensis]ANH36855.1 hypothetical protein I601_0403 [Nocardioides dokdonensis FR1436]